MAMYIIIDVAYVAKSKN